MRYHEIIEEASVPMTDYGYWIDPNGQVYPVGRFDHEPTIMKLLPGMGGISTALYLGWVRVVAYEDYLAIEMFPSRCSIRSMSNLRKIMELHEWTDIHLDDLDLNGRESVQFGSVKALSLYLQDARRRTPAPLPDRVEELLRAMKDKLAA